jgi:hypothetical protein
MVVGEMLALIMHVSIRYDTGIKMRAKTGRWGAD